MTPKELKKIIGAAKIAQEELLSLSAKTRSAVLRALARNIGKKTTAIIAANKKDQIFAEKIGKSASFIERLSLDRKKTNTIAGSLRTIAALKDTLFEVLEKTSRPSGIYIKKVRYPLGLVAIIYESRPNVTADAFAMCWKSGNAVILKGGKEIKETNKVMVKIIKDTLKKCGINPAVIQDVSGLDEKLSCILMRDERIDCLIPRGGKRLISFVQENARVPVIVTGASVVHTYVDKSADLAMACKVIVNAKTRRVSICNALDTLLVHKKIAKNFLRLLSSPLAQKNVELRADEESFGTLRSINYPKLARVRAQDYDTEFLDYILAVKIVGNFQEALAHIKKHSLGHSEAVISRSKKQAAEFFRQIDAACLYWNTSTQFSDGGEFGMGGEIGISTQKLHARGPFAHKELTTYKYLVESEGAARR